MKRIIILLFILFIGLSSYGAKMKQPVGLTDEELSSMNSVADSITKKMYSGTFLSPSDTSALIGIKIKLDDSMLLSPDARYGALYYKLGKIYQKRGNTQEAIECYQAIIENFPDTALAPKAAFFLKQMGIKVILPQKNIEEDEE